MNQYSYFNSASYYVNFLTEKFWEKHQVAEELAEPSKNEDLIRKVFENQNILDNILRNVSSDAMNQLKLRLVSPSFNSAMLHKIRLEHREVVIGEAPDFEFSHLGMSKTIDNSITINHQTVASHKTSWYFKFLKSVAGVRVKNLRINEFSSKYSPKKILHDEIMDNLICRDYDLIEEFLGMQYLCPTGCDSCGDCAIYSKKYGPVQMTVIEEFFEDRHHFDSLMLSDSEIIEFTNSFVLSCDSKEEALERLGEYSPVISCDHLTLTMSNGIGSSRYSEIGGSDGKFSHGFPREVMDIFIRKWKVKTVKLEFQSSKRHGYQTESYLEMLTKASFDGSYWKTPITENYVLESVEMDLEFISEVFEEVEDVLTDSCLDNFLANVRRIFPTKNLTLKLPNDFSLFKADNIDRFIPKFMKMAGMDPQRHINTTFNLFPTYSRMMFDIPEILNSGARLLNHECHDQFYLYDVTDISEGDAVGKSFCLKNPMTNNSIKFNVFFIPYYLKMMFDRKKEGRNLGYLRHFWSLVHN